MQLNNPVLVLDEGEAAQPQSTAAKVTPPSSCWRGCDRATKAQAASSPVLVLGKGVAVRQLHELSAAAKPTVPPLLFTMRGRPAAVQWQVRVGLRRSSSSAKRQACASPGASCAFQ